MSTWNTTSTNSRFGSTGVGPAIEGSSSTAWRSKQSPSIPSRTSPWSNVPRGQRVRPQPVGAKTGNLSEVNNHLSIFRIVEEFRLFNPVIDNRTEIVYDNNMRCALYARVSTTDQNCEMQLRELREYISRREWTNAGEYIDTGFSGSKASRPALDRLMADAAQHKFSCICVYKIDRYGRSVLNLNQQLEIGRASCR